MGLNIIKVAYPPFGPMTPRPLNVITDFIIHHSAGSLTQTPLEIDAEHRSIGDAGIAYNWIITPDGKVYDGRPINFVPAAAFGRNLQSVDVCLIGQFHPSAGGYTGPPTDAQYSSLVDLCVWAHKQYPTIECTIGHRDVATAYYKFDEADYATDCPGDKCQELLPKIRQAVNQILKAM
jgi:hypothetical protein